MTAVSADAAARAIVADPALIPHGIDESGNIAFERTTSAQIRAASFLDGREPIGTPAGVAAPAALARRLSAVSPVPTILHVSFCGSTLLARLLDRPGRALVYREPAIQIALADRLVAGLPIAPALAVATALLGRPVDGDVAVVKPTNWANVLLPAWAEQRMIAPLFLTMSPRRFLTAVFRGGRDRIAFTLRAASHFAQGDPDGSTLFAAAVAQDEEPLARAARLTLVALELQLRLFAAARMQLGSGPVMDEAEIRADPVAAAERAADIFGLPAPLDPGPAIAAHAKDSARRFQPEAEAATNRAIEDHHGSTFDAALRWAARAELNFA